MPFELPPLPYAFNALEPHIDATTMEIHYSKHHLAYVNKLNDALVKEPGLKSKSLEELLMNLNLLPPGVRMAIRNHGGGHWNHSFFWQSLRAVDAYRATFPSAPDTLTNAILLGSLLVALLLEILHLHQPQPLTTPPPTIA